MIVKQAELMKGLWIVCLCGLVLLGGCSGAQGPGVEPSTPPSGAGSYDAHSWKTLIASSCRRYSDGCNTCSRSADAALAACTHRACAEYGRPLCLDDAKVPTALGKDSPTAMGKDSPTALDKDSPAALDKASPAALDNDQLTVMEYECDGGNHFLVFYKQYVVDNERLELNQNQVMLSDRQTQTVSLLTRVPSASGERYQGDGLDYWSQGDAAMVRKDEQPLYRNCVIP